MTGGQTEVQRLAQDQPAWYVRAFEALVSPQPLSPDRCLQACAIVGGLASASVVLAMFVGPVPQGMAWLVTMQGVIGMVVVAGAGLSWIRPHALRAYLLTIGIGLVVLVGTYPASMAVALQKQSVTRFSHAPGALAMSLAFGLRLLVDFGIGNEATRARFARPVALTGMAVGACLDVLVVFMMVFLT